jgi:hypothetical protein
VFVENKDIVILLVLGWLCEVTTKFSFVVYWPNSIRCALMILYLSFFLRHRIIYRPLKGSRMKALILVVNRKV